MGKPSIASNSFFLIFRAAQKVEEGVTSEIMKKFADDKKVSKKEKDERFVLFHSSIITKGEPLFENKGDIHFVYRFNLLPKVSRSLECLFRPNRKMFRN